MRLRITFILFLAFSGLLALSGPALGQALRESNRTQQGHLLRSLEMARALGKGPALRFGTTHQGVSAAKGGPRVMSVDGGAISGQVTGLSGNDYTAGTILAISTDTSALNDPSGNVGFGFAQVGADGSYKIENLPAGDYWVLADVAGYMTEIYENAISFENATIISVTDGDERSGVDFSLEKYAVGAGSISGLIVRDGDGAPIEGAQVYVFSMDNPFLSAMTVSGPDGAYEVSGIVDGSYYVEAYAEGYFPELYDNALEIERATVVTVTEPNATGGINFSLARGAGISGRVVDAAGAPIAGVIVCAFNGDLNSDSAQIDPNGDVYGDNPGGFDGFSTCAITDDNGEYTIGGLPEGEYLVVAQAQFGWSVVVEWYNDAPTPELATAVAVANEETTSGIDFVLDIPLAADGVIAGTVTDENGNPIADAFVYVESSMNSTTWNPFWGYAQTDANGAYRIEGIPDGDYIVSAYAQSGWAYAQVWWPNAQTPDGAGVVTVAAGVSDPASVDLTLALRQGTGTISGTVLLSDGTPLAGAGVNILSMDDKLMLGMAVITDASGQYEVSGLPGGIYLAYAAYSDGVRFADQWFENATTPETATVIELADGGSRDDVDFNLTLRSCEGSITGVVVDNETGAPIPNAFVDASPIGGASPNPYGGYGSYGAVTNENGEYVIEMVADGEYIVSVYADGAFEFYEDAQTPESATPVSITGGAAVVNFGLTRRGIGSGSISGTVTAEGQGLSDALVVAQSVNDFNGACAIGYTSADGSYSIGGLAEGEYYVMSFQPGYIAEFYNDTYDPAMAELVKVGSGETGGIDFDLAVDGCFGPDSVIAGGDGGIIFGKVSDRSGRGLNGATVYLVNAAGTTIASARAGVDGSYRLANVPPSAGYRAYATNPGFTTQFNDNAPTLDQAQPVVVGKGQRQMNFSLSQATSAVINPPKAGEAAIMLDGVRPNPFNGATAISFTLGTSMHVRVAVFNTLGEEVATLLDGDLSAGAHSVSWNGVDAAGTPVGAGVYYYRVQNGVTAESGTMTVAR